MLHRNGYTYLSCDLYIYLVTYICPTKFSDVGFCRLNSSYVRPKLKVIGQMSCQVKYLFAALIIVLCLTPDDFTSQALNRHFNPLRRFICLDVQIEYD
jgi:hypothetical protein